MHNQVNAATYRTPEEAAKLAKQDVSKFNLTRREEEIEYKVSVSGQRSAIIANSLLNPAYAKEMERLEPALVGKVSPETNSGQTKMPPLSDLEKKRFDIYTQLLERAIINLPERARDEILTRFTASIERDGLNLPTPHIVERTDVRAAATRMERSR